MKKNIFKKIEKAVYENTLLYVPKFIDIQNKIDINTIADILNTTEAPNHLKTVLPINKDDVFSHTYQIKNVEQYPIIFPLHEIIKNNLPQFFVDRTDLFFSMKKSLGPNHIDPENSLIVAVLNNTIYHFPGEGSTVLMEPGDLLLVPTGKTHFASSYQARIILSWGLYKK